MTPVQVTEGSSPVILTFPHGGRYIPDSIENRLNSNGLERADTDWHIQQIYEGLLKGATLVEATFHRYVIDANRDPKGHSLYPRQNTTALCPLTDFDGNEIWREGQRPSAEEVEERCQTFHRPYHLAIIDQIERVRKRYGRVVVYDCHSIRSRIAHLFNGVLPDFNVGTNDGSSCAPSLEAEIVARCHDANDFTYVLNGRFKGGWTTRHYGSPAHGVHALQMELAQSTYMVEASPWSLNNAKTSRLQPHLKHILTNLEAFALEGRL